MVLSGTVSDIQCDTAATPDTMLCWWKHRAVYLRTAKL